MEQKAMKRAALGRGLSALIPGGSPAERKGVLVLGIEEVQPDRGQPRHHFDEAHILELAESIRSKGILQPLLVRRDGDGYVIVAGERRWRAGQRAGLREIPCLVRDVSEDEAFELALIENIQREDLNPVEEAEAYQRLIEDHGLTQDELAQRVGKDRSTVANVLRLLRLPESIKLALTAGTLTMGHARALLGLSDDADLRRAAEKVIGEKLSVRQVEQLVHRLKGRKVVKKERAGERSVQLRHVVEKLQRKLGTKVALRDRGAAGTLEIQYHSHGELDRLLTAILGEG